ncbi:hypothetical protein CGRA01v4_12251 [Colletotrichum graminicola]|nr:hypothetical protein CGRA01v4_12251 [Colletotrichum graminicola]
MLKANLNSCLLLPQALLPTIFEGMQYL